MLRRKKPKNWTDITNGKSLCDNLNATLYLDYDRVYSWRIINVAFPFNTPILYPNKILWGALSPNAIIPSKRKEDAGYDIYADDRIHEFCIPPHTVMTIPTGLCTAFHYSKVGILKERGSTAIKNIGQRGGILDSGYRGEWLVPITNHNDKPILFTPYVKENEKLKNDYIIYDLNKAICQVLFFDLPVMESVTVSPDIIQTITSERKDTGFGASGK